MPVGDPRRNDGAGWPDLGGSLALVAFGTGVGGFSLDEAARIEVEEVRKHLNEGSEIERIVFAVRGGEAREAFERGIAG